MDGSNRPTKFVCCRTRPCLRLYIPALARAPNCTYGVSFLLCHRSRQQARVRPLFLHILGRHSLPQPRALRSLKLQLIQQDCTSLDTAMRLYLYLPSQRDLQVPFGAIPIPLGVGGPGQQHTRPLPLLPRKGQLL